MTQVHSPIAQTETLIKFGAGINHEGQAHNFDASIGGYSQHANPAINAFLQGMMAMDSRASDISVGTKVGHDIGAQAIAAVAGMNIQYNGR